MLVADRVLRLLSVQEKGRYRIEFPEAGARGTSRNRHGGQTAMSSQQRSSANPPQDEYRILHEADLRDYLAGLPAVATRLGGAPASWSIGEVGDGNLNLVFIVKGAAGGIA